MSSTSLSDMFWTVVKVYKSCELGIEALTAFESVMRDFLPRLEELDLMERQLFLDQYYDELVKIKWSLSKNRPFLPSFQSLHDKFTKIMKISKNPPTKITHVFESFVKGITYFSNQKPSTVSPVYHRIASCGPWSSTLGCFDPTSKKTSRLAASRIARCYIERLIYDEIFKNEALFFPESGSDEPKQNKGHENWIQKTKQEFKSCFPNIDIRVELSEFDNGLPTCLTIQRFSKTDKTRDEYKLSSVEAFRKDVVHGPIKTYGRFVSCTLKTPSGQNKAK